jgi:hypothetical protein
MRRLSVGPLLPGLGSELAFLAAFSLSAPPQAPASLTQDQRYAEIHELHQELNAITARLKF